MEEMNTINGNTLASSTSVYWKTYLQIFGLYVIVSCIIFRVLLFNAPGIWQGDLIVGPDELIPIFDIHSQYWDQLGNSSNLLTNQYEFRIRYAFLTSWLRYYQLIPFSIVLTVSIAAYICFLFVSKFTSKLLEDNSPRVIWVTAMTTLLPFLIVFASKAVHFYSLGAGFALYTISLILLLQGVFLSKKIINKSIVLSVFLCIINPAVHYVLLYLVTTLIIGMSVLVQSFQRPYRSNIPMKIVQILLIVFGVTIPYFAFVHFFVIHGVSDTAELIPVHYRLIAGNSVSLIKQFTLNITSATDNWAAASGITTGTRMPWIFYSLLIVFPFFSRKFLRILSQDIQRRGVFIALYCLCLFAVWGSLGYSKIWIVPGFYSLLSFVAQHLYQLNADVILTIINEFIHVLRFPHRFQLIFFSVLIVLLPIGILFMQSQISTLMKTWTSKNIFQKPLLRSSLAALGMMVFFVPLLSNPGFRDTLFSGDLSGFLKPYPATSLREIRDSLYSLPEGETIVLPPAEANKIDIGDNGSPYELSDKFFIYYLNKPSYYYGLTSDIDHKIIFNEILNSLMRKDTAWIPLIRQLEIKYIILNKEIGPGFPSWRKYLESSEKLFPEYFDHLSTILTKKKDNKRFALYEISDAKNERAGAILLDLERPQFLQVLDSFSPTEKVKILWPSLLFSFHAIPNVIVGNDRSKTALDIYTSLHPESFSTADITIANYQIDIIPSQIFSNTVFSLPAISTYTPSANFLRMIAPDLLDTLTGTFVGLPKRSSIRFPLHIPSDGEYAVYLRGAFTKNTVLMELNGKQYPRRVIDEKDSRTLYAAIKSLQVESPEYVNPTKYSQNDLEKAIPSKIYPVSNQFTYINLGTIDAKKGGNWLFLNKLDNNPMVVEGVLIVKKDEEKDITTLPPNVTFMTPEQFTP